jgi:hypothetical protein
MTNEKEPVKTALFCSYGEKGYFYGELKFNSNLLIINTLINQKDA